MSAICEVCKRPKQIVKKVPATVRLIDFDLDPRRIKGGWLVVETQFREEIASEIMVCLDCVNPERVVVEIRDAKTKIIRRGEKMKVLIVKEGEMCKVLPFPERQKKRWIDFVQEALGKVDGIETQVINTVKDLEQKIKTGGRIAAVLFVSEDMGKEAERIAGGYLNLTVIIATDDPISEKKANGKAIWFDRLDLSNIAKLRQAVLR